MEFYFIVQLSLASAGVSLYISNRASLILIPLAISILFGLLIFFCLADLFLRTSIMQREIRRQGNVSWWQSLDNKSLFYIPLFTFFVSLGLVMIGLSATSESLASKLHLENKFIIVSLPTIIYLGLYFLIYLLVLKFLKGYITNLESFHKETIKDLMDKE